MRCLKLALILCLQFSFCVLPGQTDKGQNKDSKEKDLSLFKTYLCKKSFLLNKKRMYWFKNYPSTVRLETDPGVLFVISLAYYKQTVREVLRTIMRLEKWCKI